MAMFPQIPVLLDGYEDDRILLLSQNTIFGECPSQELVTYETQLLVLLYSPFVEHEQQERGTLEFDQQRFRLELDAFKIQFSCEKDSFLDCQIDTGMPEPVTSLHEGMIVEKDSVLIKRETIASGIVESLSSATMPLSSLFHRMGHGKKFCYDEWKSLVKKNITDWQFLDSSNTSTIYNICPSDSIDASETSTVRIEIGRMATEMDELEAKLEGLEYGLQNLEQNARRNWLVLHGVFEKDKENTFEVMIEVVKQKTGLQINPQDVENCHRMGRRRYRNKADPIKLQQNKRPIVIKFVNYCKRKALWDHKKFLRGSGLLLTESLTNTRLELLQTAREIFGEKSVWSQDGRIMYRMADGSKVRINNLDDLKAISNKL